MLVVDRWQRNLEDFVERHSLVLLLLGALFVIGVVFGALAVRSVDTRERAELAVYLGDTLKALLRPAGGEGGLLLKQALWRSAKVLGLLWVLGISLVGIFGVMGLALVRGFISGFAVGFLAAELGWKGLLVAVAGHLPHSLIEVPALLVGGTAAVAFSLQVVRSWRQGRRLPHFYPALARFTGTLMATGLALMVGGLVESYLSPALVRFALSFLQSM